MAKKRIAVLTATRAEYGILRPLIERFYADGDLEISLLVTGAHLAEEFGNTYREILEDGFPIAVKIPILEKGDTAAAVSRTMANALAAFGGYFEKNRADMLVVLGDRYETLAVCLAAMNARIPIAHLHGGEITEGAVDDAVRHSITKLSYLHFPSTQEYANRIIQLGESPDRVFPVGALGVENIRKVPLMTRTELEASLDFPLGDSYAVVTFHPVTLEAGSVESQFQALLDALDDFTMKYIITRANADAGGRVINRMIDQYAAGRGNVYAVASLGIRRYLSAVKYSRMVIGNSSSGIIEAPSFQVPTVNIGDRQRGRTAAESVIHCEAERGDIRKAMEEAAAMKERLKEEPVRNPYEGEGTSGKIAAVCKDFLLHDRIDLKKTFYDLHGKTVQE